MGLRRRVLVRQLVEVEYLSWATTDDPADAWEWFTSDQRCSCSAGSPARIRQWSEGRFPNTDYRDHREAGGHPVPQPAMKILDNRALWVEVTPMKSRYDGSATWHYLLSALEDIAPISAIEEQHNIVDAAYRSRTLTDDLDSAFRSASSG